MAAHRRRLHSRLMLAIFYIQQSLTVIESAPDSTFPPIAPAPCLPPPPAFPDWRQLFAGTLASLGGSVVTQLIGDAKMSVRSHNLSTTFCVNEVNIADFNARLNGCNPVDLSAICQPQQTAVPGTAAFIPTTALTSTAGLTSSARMTSAPVTSGPFTPPPETTISGERSPITASKEAEILRSTLTSRSFNDVSSTFNSEATTSQQKSQSNVHTDAQTNTRSTGSNATVSWQDQTPKTGEVVSPSSNGELGPGGVAGVVIGVLVFVILLVLVCVVVFVRCRQTKPPVHLQQPNNSTMNHSATSRPHATAAGSTFNINYFTAHVRQAFSRPEIHRGNSQSSTKPIIASRQSSVNSDTESDRGMPPPDYSPIRKSQFIANQNAMDLPTVDERGTGPDDLLNFDPGTVGASVPGRPKSDPPQRRLVVHQNGSTSTLPRNLHSVQNGAAKNGRPITASAQSTPPWFGIDNRGFRSDSIDDGTANKLAVNSSLQSAFDNVMNKLSQTEQGCLDIEMGSTSHVGERTASRDAADRYGTSTSSLDLAPPDESLADSSPTVNI